MNLPIILIAIFVNGADLKSSISISSRFETMEECEVAKEKIVEAYSSKDSFMGMNYNSELIHSEDIKCINLQ